MKLVSSSPQFVLLLSSAIMSCSAAALWASKTRQLVVFQAQQNVQMETAQQENACFAADWLRKNYRADNQLSYSALSRTMVFVGHKRVETTAKITRAPRHLSLQFLSGTLKGTQTGYSGRCFWRQDAGQKMRPYAQVARNADQIAAWRFELLLKNYFVRLGKQKNLHGRRVQIVELRPRSPFGSATGPARRLGIDVQSGLTLSIESFNCDLKPVSFSQLSHLDLQPRIVPATFKTPAAIMASLPQRNWQGEELAQNFDFAGRKTGVLPPRPAWLPPGFELESYGVHRCLTTGTLQIAALSRYTDGLNTLSLFAFQPATPNIQKNMRGNCDFGPGTLVSREDGAGRLVALGDLPAKTLEKVLKSTRFTATKFETTR